MTLEEVRDIAGEWRNMIAKGIDGLVGLEVGSGSFLVGTHEHALSAARIAANSTFKVFEHARNPRTDAYSEGRR